MKQFQEVYTLPGGRFGRRVILLVARPTCERWEAGEQCDTPAAALHRSHQGAMQELVCVRHAHDDDEWLSPALLEHGGEPG